ncbi:phage holin family protein [Paenibacillus sp. GSMTC-2017]|uniref:phage holin family protein n=1 Tax=Paenibacillus sp. GSMTC-2017 TaxID=2794350 RepID=UPI0018D84BCC|nr:phage holin family protein [Paenibacillus sp. GSMTC-2017]MBH5316691.1 phage holin family protein [Paenibacillus sp. GSMTC-2017]
MENFTFKFLANRDWTMLYATSGFFGSLLSYMFGGWTGILELLIIVFGIDYISGIAASIIERKGVKSTVGFIGLGKKGLVLLTVFLGYKLDQALGLTIVMNGVIYFWLSNEMVSILENYARCGLKTPEVFKKILTILQEKSGEKTEIKPDAIQTKVE